MAPLRRGLLRRGLALATLASRFRRPDARRLPGEEAVDDPVMAQAYDRVTGWPQALLGYSLIACRLLRGQSEGRALDLGCGPGRLAVALARQAPRLEIVGLDLSEEMLALARTRAARHGLSPRVSFLKGDNGRIPCPDASFDFVVSSSSLHHWADPVAVFDEVARVLKPAGRFLVVDLRRDLPPGPYLGFWSAQNLFLPPFFRQRKEPLSSVASSYTAAELARLASRSRLPAWRAASGPAWLILESRL